MSSAAQKQKPGKVVRLNPTTWKFIESHRKEGESIAQALERITGASGAEVLYALPSDLAPSLAEARGRAVLKAVKSKSKPERPVPVKVEE